MRTALLEKPPTASSRGGFGAVLLVGWLVLSAAGFLYAREKNIPAWAAVPLIAAFLLEFSFYLVPGFETVRMRLAPRLSGWMLASSALAPYVVYSIPAGQFHWSGLALLAVVILPVSYWYAIFRPSRFADLGLLAILVAAALSRVLERSYLSPVTGVPVEILGKLMLIRLAATVMLILRGMPDAGYGFVPAARDWRVGARYFVYFAAVGFPLAWGLGLIRFEGATIWKALPTFFGVLWVVALSEEFVFRGLLQRWLAEWTRKPRAALLLASVLFGLCHLSFRGFPNWRFALVAAIAGWFYGRAFDRAGSIRASMVTHALVVTTWRVLA
jgi:membrane protease YdiL (CAAX protease family)